MRQAEHGHRREPRHHLHDLVERRPVLIGAGQEALVPADDEMRIFPFGGSFVRNQNLALAGAAGVGAGAGIVAPTGEELQSWSLLGRTCRGNDAPGAQQRPTMAMVVDAFHHTPWARVTLGFQPDGYLTLVNLTSFYEAKWSATGYGPGSVDRVEEAGLRLLSPERRAMVAKQAGMAGS